MPRRFPPRQDMYKTKLCPFTKPGRPCSQPHCSYAHSDEELRPAPNLFHTKLCPSILHEKVCKKKNCGYAHSSSEIEGHKIGQLFFKTQICNFWPGNCKNGNRCRFAHGSEDLNSKIRLTIPLQTQTLQEGLTDSNIVSKDYNDLSLERSDSNINNSKDLDISDFVKKDIDKDEVLYSYSNTSPSYTDISEFETASSLSGPYSQSTSYSKSIEVTQENSSVDKSIFIFSPSNTPTLYDKKEICSKKMEKMSNLHHQPTKKFVYMTHNNLSQEMKNPNSIFVNLPNLAKENLWDNFPLHPTYNKNTNYLINLVNTGNLSKAYFYED